MVFRSRVALLYYVKHYQSVWPTLDTHTSFYIIPFNDYWIFNADLFVPNHLPSCSAQSLNNDPIIDWLLTFITTQIGLANMFEFFVVSTLRMKIKKLWKKRHCRIECDSVLSVPIHSNLCNNIFLYCSIIRIVTTCAR